MFHPLIDFLPVTGKQLQGKVRHDLEVSSLAVRRAKPLISELDTLDNLISTNLGWGWVGSFSLIQRLLEQSSGSSAASGWTLKEEWF